MIVTEVILNGIWEGREGRGREGGGGIGREEREEATGKRDG